MKSKWVMITKRTNEPKLCHFEDWLTQMGIPHRRNGQSFWAPILEVPKEFEQEAWEMLGKKVGRRTYDDIPDSKFQSFARDPQSTIDPDWPWNWKKDKNGFVIKVKNPRRVFQFGPRSFALIKKESKPSIPWPHWVARDAYTNKHITADVKLELVISTLEDIKKIEP